MNENCHPFVILTLPLVPPIIVVLNRVSNGATPYHTINFLVVDGVGAGTMLK